MNYSVFEITESVDMNLNAVQYNEYFFIDASAGNIEITLPSDKSTGDYYQFHRLDSSTNTVLLIPSSGDSIDGQSSISFSSEFGQIVKRGSDWLTTFINL